MQFDIRKFDIYRKVPKDLSQPTKTGAIISMFSVFFILYLLAAELFSYMTPELTSVVYVDDPAKNQENIPVHLKIHLHKMACRFIGIDIQDNMGRHDVGYVYNSKKTDLPDGGCLFDTVFAINKVSGNFHVATHSADEQPLEYDFAHTIEVLRFGLVQPSHLDSLINFQTSFKPLNGRKIENVTAAYTTYEYFLNIVPTVVEQAGHRRFPYQFTALPKHGVNMIHGSVATPAIWFRYELAPIAVEYREKHIPFYHFLTQVCAIIGGTFTVAGIIDSMIFSAHEMVKKIEIGKHS